MNIIFRRLPKLLIQLIIICLVISFIVVIPFRWFNPPLTMVMMNRWLNATTENYTLQQQWLSWGQIPKHAALAVMTSEDQRFAVHYGFDISSIKQSLKSIGSGRRLRGASTITQQVARNIYLWTGRSWVRKGLEAWFTLLIELTWSKQRILEVYLNIAEWGDGVFGLEAASQYHFGYSAAQLTPMQSALLASSLPNPLEFDPANPSKYLIDRAHWNIEQQKWFTREL